MCTYTKQVPGENSSQFFFPHFIGLNFRANTNCSKRKSKKKEENPPPPPRKKRENSSSVWYEKKSIEESRNKYEYMMRVGSESPFPHRALIYTPSHSISA
jgi:hypothetical protein